MTELVWVKSAPLSLLRLGLKIVLVLLGVLFFFAVASGKGSYKNVEGLLGLLAIHIALSIRSDVRLASSGDVLDSYDERGGDGERKVFSQWVQAMPEDGDSCKLGSATSPYYYWINLSRVAWARPCFAFEAYPLVALPVFCGYLWLVDFVNSSRFAAQMSNFNLNLSPILADLNLLTFPEGMGNVTLLSWLIVLCSLIAVAASIGKAVDVRACGGVQDRFVMTGADRALFLDALAGRGPTIAETKPAAVAPAPAAPPAVEPKPFPAVTSAES